MISLQNSISFFVCGGLERKNYVMNYIWNFCIFKFGLAVLETIISILIDKGVRTKHSNLGLRKVNDISDFGNKKLVENWFDYFFLLLFFPFF